MDVSSTLWLMNGPMLAVPPMLKLHIQGRRTYAAEVRFPTPPYLTFTSGSNSRGNLPAAVISISNFADVEIQAKLS